MTRNGDIHSPKQFAVDRLDAGRALINQSPQIALDEFGLPNQIEIHRERAFWDIDTAETPAEWMYNGFSITVPYLRSADTSTGECLPRNYRPGDFIDVVTVRLEPGPVALISKLGIVDARAFSKMRACAVCLLKEDEQ